MPANRTSESLIRSWSPDHDHGLTPQKPEEPLVHDLSVRVITEDGELVRELTLDPTRDYQALSG